MPFTDETKQTLSQLEGLLNADVPGLDKESLRESIRKVGFQAILDAVPPEFAYLRDLLQERLGTEDSGGSTLHSITPEKTRLRELRESIKTSDGREFPAYAMAAILEVKPTGYTQVEAGNLNSQDLKHGRLAEYTRRVEEILQDEKLLTEVYAQLDNRSLGSGVLWQRIRDYLSRRNERLAARRKTLPWKKN